MVGVFVSVLLFVVSLGILLAASDAFTSAAEQIGLSLGISPFIIGVTIVAGGTSLPELISSLLAVSQGVPAIVMGSVVGSNISNMLFVLGLAAVVGGDIRVIRELVEVDLPLLVASAVFLVVATWNSPFSWYEGLLALAALAVYIQFTIKEKDRYVGMLIEEVIEDRDEEVAERPEGQVDMKTYAKLVLSLIFVFGAAYVLVESIVDLATALQIGTEIVAITAVAVGTSLPEVIVSVMAVRKDLPGLAVGNVLGSNLFNSFLVTGVPSLVGDLVIPASIRSYGLPVMLLITILYFFITQDREITRSEGMTLLVLYVLFLVNLGAFIQ
ncbi:CaCA family Na(+)/Ca(+) antiporter [Haloferax prahovense DSM 18310]|uniref:CaCA family Na(+)/Ca(+) antiporter n=1 Tax=Haloferax prahovense (strain DSM 18310 / JCM 13924 / TL6) TaxID=1227461 RepID=M0G8R1_HALPT|nr:calcium/sodium antiporter [Haloferax prahovense]ELZ68580.1 CaCA family Na(+)/Ca(+) antiporter [Haloferax prahovense DSM 18310]